MSFVSWHLAGYRFTTSVSSKEALSNDYSSLLGTACEHDKVAQEGFNPELESSFIVEKI